MGFLARLVGLTLCVVWPFSGVDLEAQDRPKPCHSFFDNDPKPDDFLTGETEGTEIPAGTGTCDISDVLPGLTQGFDKRFGFKVSCKDGGTGAGAGLKSTGADPTERSESNSNKRGLGWRLITGRPADKTCSHRAKLSGKEVVTTMLLLDTVPDNTWIKVKYEGTAIWTGNWDGFLVTLKLRFDFEWMVTKTRGKPMKAKRTGSFSIRETVSNPSMGEVLLGQRRIAGGSLQDETTITPDPRIPANDPFKIDFTEMTLKFIKETSLILSNFCKVTTTCKGQAGNTPPSRAGGGIVMKPEKDSQKDEDLETPP